MFRIDKPLAALSVALLLWTAVPSAAQAPSSRLEGYLLDVDGKAAAGYHVHLIDADGKGVARTEASAQGVYSFRGLVAGSYAMGIEDTAGRMAPVAAPPVALEAGGLARRDIKLIASEDPRHAKAGMQNQSLGLFWAGLSPAAKAWSVIGIAVVLGVAIQALDDEASGSQSDPG